MAAPTEIRDAPATPPWSRPVDDVAVSVATSLDTGLSATDAAARLRRDGPNELEAAPPVPLWHRVVQQVTDPLVLLLLVAIVVSFAAWVSDGADGMPIDAIVIAVIVVANAAIGVWQEVRAVAAVEALGRLASTHTRVVRDGRPIAIPTCDLVVGDVVLFSAGDAVGADCRLVEVASLEVAEAALTGESTPVGKHDSVVSTEAPLAERSNMVFSGTAVTSGRARAVVVATGMASEIGRIATMIDRAGRERTPLQREMEWLGKVLGVIVVVIASVVVTAVVVTSDLDTFGDVVDALLVGVSIAVAAVPEGLPAILSIVLAMGVQRMANDNAIVKRLSSVETLGSASVICTDKTGTLTRNEMTIVTLLTPSGRADLGGPRDVSPTADLRGPDGAPAEPAVEREVELLVTAGSLASDAMWTHDESGAREPRGDPTEVAFLVAERTMRANRTDERPERVHELPFDADRRLMSTVVHADFEWELAGTDAHDLIVFTKGAPEAVLAGCDRERIDGVIQDLTAERLGRYLGGVDVLADEALRTLAVAYRPIGRSVLERGELLERDLILLGIVGIVDPPRDEAFDAVREAQRGGVRVIMITGDHPRTAGRIAGQLGIGTGEDAVAGPDLATMTDDEVRSTLASANVFARVEPEHKLRIVTALQSDGSVTAMTGDGVNDAPALKQADIGVAMGLNGSDVSKEAADMVLADDNFATILVAVREGREIFDNIRKFVRYLLASNSGEVLVVLLGVLFASYLGLTGSADGLAVPLLATQILWINLVTDGALALALGVDPAVEDVMDRPPRAVHERIVDRPMLGTVAVVGLATAAVSLIALDLTLAGGLFGGSGDIETGRTMVFTTLVLAQVGNAFSTRSDVASVAAGAFANRLLWAAAGVTVAAQVLVVHAPGLGDAFSTTPLSTGQWAICVGLASVVVVVAELRKVIVRVFRRRHA